MRSVLRIMAPLVCRVGLVTLGLLSGGCPAPPTAEPAPDLAPPADLSTDQGPDCEAAKGLAADKRLLCVDFTTNGPPQIAGWTFPMNCGADTWKWTIVGGALTLSSFENFGGADMQCSFTSPSIDAGSSSTLTLSILQAVHLRTKTSQPGETANQRAQVMVNDQTPPLVQFTGGGSAKTGGTSAPSFRRSTIQVDKVLLYGGRGQFKFNITSSGVTGGEAGDAGWWIKSIAVLGHK